MNWRDTLLFEDPTPEMALRALYAQHLGSSHSIYCKHIKATTVEAYVFAAATFLAQFSGVDFRKDNPSDTRSGHILYPCDPGFEEV